MRHVAPLLAVLVLSPIQEATVHGRPLHPSYATSITRPSLPVPAPRVQPPLGSDAEVRERYDRACDLVGADDCDAALEEFVWLWTATDNKASAFEPEIRHDIIASIGRVAADHEPTRVRFTAILDGLDAFVRADPPQSFREWTDWAELSRAMHQEDRLIKLYEERRASDGSLDPFRPLSEKESAARLAAGEFPFSKTMFHPYAFDDLFEVLLERGRFADAGRLHSDLVHEAEFTLTLHDELLQKEAEHFSASFVEESQQKDRKTVALLYALGLAAERPADAEGVAAALLERYDDLASREALVQACARVGVSSPAVTRWLAEIQAARTEDAPK